MFTTLIKPTQLLQNISNENWRIFDTRFVLTDLNQGSIEYSLSHIPGSVYLHLNNDLSGRIIPGKTGRHPLPSRYELQIHFSKWGISPQSQVIIYDHFHGGIAARLWWMLQWMGHKNVAVLDGGWQSWISHNYPVTTSIPEVPPTQFIPVTSNFNTVDAEQVLVNVKEKTYLLVDSRIHSRYLGEFEPIDPVAGHIPTAKNLPFIKHVEEGKGWRSSEEIIVNFAEIIPENNLKEVVFYCGSGVTACHNVLAYKHAGIGTGILYPGSWSDWITNDKRPIQTGK